MKGEASPPGYTIVEVMIVLAISGLMFLMASNFISGRQATTAFTQGANELGSRLQNTIEQVSDGQYSDAQINCSYIPALFGPPATVTFPVVGTNGQGHNENCVFLGKMLHFQTDRLDGSDPEQNYETFAIAAGRFDSQDNPITADAASPTPLHATGLAVVTNATNTLTTQDTIPQHLSVTKVMVGTNNGTVITNGIGFLQSLGSIDTNTGTLKNGAQTVQLYYVDPTVSGAYGGVSSDATAVPQLNGNALKLANSVDICLTDDTRKADIQIGANNNQLNVTTTIYVGPGAGSGVACP